MMLRSKSRENMLPNLRPGAYSPTPRHAATLVGRWRAIYRNYAVNLVQALSSYEDGASVAEPRPSRCYLFPLSSKRFLTTLHFFWFLDARGGAVYEKAGGQA